MTADPTPTRTSFDPEVATSAATDGRRRVGVAILAAALGLLWLGLAMQQYSGGVDVIGDAQGAWAIDLAAYVEAAERLLAIGSPYAAEQVGQAFEPGRPGLFYYAPPFGAAMLPFTGLDFAGAALAWWLLRVGALLLACGLMPVRPTTRALAFAVVAFSLPALKDSVIGNVSLLLLLPIVLGWRWLDRPAGSIALAVAMTVRPSLAVVLGWQVLRRAWKPAMWTVVAGLAFVALTLPLVGIDGYRDYIAVLANLRVPAAWSENRDLGALALAVTGHEGMVGAARFAGIALGLGAILLSLRADRETGYVVAVGASLLVAPLLWDHYLATLIIPAAFLAQRTHPAWILVPLLAWVPVLSPVLVIVLVVLPLVLRRESRSVPASAPATAWDEPTHA